MKLFNNSDKKSSNAKNGNPPEKALKPKPGGGTVVRSHQEDPVPDFRDKEPEQDLASKRIPLWQPGDEILGLYQVEQVISGGMGHVYIVHHNKWNVKLAVKQPNEMMLADEDNFARILREANAWTEMGLHPNIAYCYYVRNITDVPHIVVEYVDGGNLRDWIDAGKCIDYRVNLDLAIQFCHGMEFAHSKGMIHRDIKPENVLMTEDGHLKITDFGLVRSKEVVRKQEQFSHQDDQIDTSPLTKVGTVMGTEGYMAPEQIKDPHRVDERADIFSFGVCLYEMFCGNKPFPTTATIANKPPDPKELSKDEGFPDDLADVLIKCVKKVPGDRYNSFRDIRIRLCSIYKKLCNKQSPYAELESVGLAAGGLNNQGVSFLELGRKEETLRCWQTALSEDPLHLETTYNLALLQWRGGKIDDLEVLRRLHNCRENPAVDKSILSELIAGTHVERFDPAAAKDALKTLPGKYETLFGNQKVDHIKDILSLKGHSKSVSSAAITANGKIALSGGWDKTIRVWEVETGRCIHTLSGHGNYVNTVAVTKDGRWGLSGSHDRHVRFWDVAGGKCIRIMEGHSDVVFAVALTNDGRRAFSASADKTLKVWDTQTGLCVQTLTGHTDWVKSIAVTADGRLALSASADKTLKVWDLKTGQCIQTLKGHAESVNTIGVTKDGRLAVSGSTDKTLKIWEIETGQCVRTLQGHTKTIYTATITNDGRRVLSGSWGGKTIRIWEVKTGRCIRTLQGHTGSVLSIAVTENSQKALSAGWDKTVRLWNIADNRACKAENRLSQPRGFKDRKKEQEDLNLFISRSAVLFEKGDFQGAYAVLFKAWKETGFKKEPSLLHIYKNLMQKGSIKHLAANFQMNILRGHKGIVNSVALTADGRRGLSASADKTLRLWDLETGQCIKTMEGHSGSVNAVAITKDGQRAVSAGWDKTLRLWELETGQCIRILTGHTESVNSVILFKTGRLGLSASDDHTLKVWELDTGRCVRTLKGHTYYVKSVAVTGDGQYAVSAGADKDLRDWEVNTGRCIRTLEGHKGEVTSVSVTKDGQKAVSASLDKTLRLWDIKAGQCIRVLKGHTGGVNAVALTADGRWALSASADKSLRLWELDSGRCNQIIEKHAAGFTAVAITGDGRIGISGSTDKTVGPWDFIWELGFARRSALSD